MPTHLTRLLLTVVLLPIILCRCFAQGSASSKPDTSPHTVRFVTIAPDVKLEILDWGGTGRPLVFLAGSGLDAHEFDEFAPKLTPQYHVYGITRRGFGASNHPAPVGDSYSADQLANDVLAVMAALDIVKPVLIGHSLAGEELSSIGSRFPGTVSALIYLEAGYSYAFYSPGLGDPIIDAKALQQQLGNLLQAKQQSAADFTSLEADTARFDRDLKTLLAQFALTPAPPPRPANAPPPPPILLALANGKQKFTSIHVPVLAIYADPHRFGNLYKDNPAKLAGLVENDRKTTSAQADALQAGIPNAQVVRIPNADHFIFTSNQAEVLQLVRDFLQKLPPVAK